MNMIKYAVWAIGGFIWSFWGHVVLVILLTLAKSDWSDYVPLAGVAFWVPFQAYSAMCNLFKVSRGPQAYEYHALAFDGEDENVDFQEMIHIVSSQMAWGFFHFGLVLASYFVVRYDRTQVIYWVLFCSEIAIGVTFQYFMYNRLVAFEGRNSQSQYEGVAKLMQDPWKVPLLGCVGIRNVRVPGTGLVLPEIYAILIQGFVDLADPTSDGANAGQSGNIVTTTGATLFSTAWRHLLWGYGDAVADKGLPWILTAHVFLFTFIQYGSWLHKTERALSTLKKFESFQTKKGDMRDSGSKESILRGDFWYHMASACDSVSLLLLSNVYDRYGRLHKRFGNKRETAVNIKLLEDGPGIWLTISLLQVTWKTNTTSGLAMNIGGIILSMVSMLTLAKDVVEEAMLHWNAVDASHEHWRVAKFSQVIGVLVQLAFYVLTSIARVVGLWACTSHIFNVSSFQRF